MLRYYIAGRLFEWSMTIPMLLLSAVTFVSPRTLEASAFQLMRIVMPIPMTLALLFVISWVAAVGLVLNGHKVKGITLGPLLRSIAAVGRAVMWSQFALALLRLSISQGYMEWGLPFWSTFILTEIYVAFSAASKVTVHERAG